jgi:plasmid stabilization system protein ParE
LPSIAPRTPHEVPVVADAQHDIQELSDWVVEHSGPDFADKTEARLYDTFDLLTQFPQMGCLRADIEGPPSVSFS